MKFSVNSHALLFLVLYLLSFSLTRYISTGGKIFSNYFALCKGTLRFPASAYGATCLRTPGSRVCGLVCAPVPEPQALPRAKNRFFTEGNHRALQAGTYTTPSQKVNGEKQAGPRRHRSSASCYLLLSLMKSSFQFSLIH